MNNPVQSQVNPPVQKKNSTPLLSVAGYILAVSYPLLALSTGVRALYQLLVRDDIVNQFGPAMSGVAALCYLVATIGFTYRKRWAWRLSVGVLGFETLMTLLIGTLSYIVPDLIGNTAWRHFGADYGYFPLFQPLLGLLWLFWPETLRSYGIVKQGKASPDEVELSRVSQ
jgi:hypothetical protein